MTASIGLLIGHFEPLHLGHLRDINTAAGLCGTLHIIITPSTKANARFTPTLQDKARWVQVACQDFDFIKVHTTKSLDVTVTGDYGKCVELGESVFAKLGIGQHESVKVFVKDGGMAHSQASTQTSTQTVKLPSHSYDDDEIYDNPIAHFYDIAPSARPSYAQTVCIVGGESSGKTTLVHKLAAHYGASVALEMGRLYAHSDLGGTEIALQYSDYTPIAINHARAIYDAKKNATAPLVFIDTDFATTQAFCEEYEGRSNPVVAALADELRMDFTIYLDNNVEWVADGIRRLGSQSQRTRFASRILQILARHDITPHIIDDADYHTRYEQAVRFIDTHVLHKA